MRWWLYGALAAVVFSVACDNNKSSTPFPDHLGFSDDVASENNELPDRGSEGGESPLFSDDLANESSTTTDDEPIVGNEEDSPHITDEYVEDTEFQDEASQQDEKGEESSDEDETNSGDTDEETDTVTTPDGDILPQICTPHETAECPYNGPPATKDVGICKAGVRTCSSDGTFWSSCTGEVLPTSETCSNGLDDNCNGQTDENSDEDGDGWGICSGDCCDNITLCADPAKVNPGAIEVPGDGVDNDCNGQIDEDPRIVCSNAQKFSGTGALDLLYAMDICKHATNGSWGIVGTPTLTRANGSGSIDSSNRQVGVMFQFGSDTSNKAIFGPTMATLSSGRARDNYDDPDKTTKISYSYYTGTPPTDFTAPYGGQLPTTKAGCPNGSGANDGVMLSVQLKVPTNALSFSFNFRFFSQEYRDWTCSKYNDFFITMLYTGASGIPADKNIAFDSNHSYISVNSDQFFTVCKPKTGYPCPDGTAALAGTGYSPDNAGATKWLATTAPVIPGETITLKFVIWDTSDQLLDSLVLIDNFKWSAQGTSGPSTFECWDLNKNGVCDAATEDQSGDGVCNERDC